jgi:GDP-mannose transporter
MHPRNIEHHLFPEKMEVTLSILTYSTCSISMILMNKLVIDTYKLDFPMGLLFLQNFAAFFLVMFAKKMEWIHYPSFEMRIVKQWLPLTLLFVSMLYTSMKSLKTMSVAVQTIIKNLAIVLTALGDAKFFGKHLSPGMFVSFGLMILGSYLGSAADKWVTSEGLFWTFANVITTVSYVLYMRVLLGAVSKEIGRYGPVFYNNLLSLPFIFPSCAATLPDLLVGISNAPPAALFCLSIMIAAGAVMTFATFWCMRVTSPTTYSVTGSLNKVPLAFLGIIIFGHYPTTMGYLGILCALGGGVLYTYQNLPKPDPAAKVEEGRRIV